MGLGSVLYVYRGEWGLPSIDLECLRALCLVKLKKFPIQIVTKGNPLLSGGGKLPYLQIGNKKFIGYRNIKRLLDKEGFPIDEHLRNSQSGQLSVAYVNWVFTNLHVYYHYFMYGDPDNLDTTRALYAKRTPFPFNFYYPGTYRKEARDAVLVMGGFDINDKIGTHECEYIISNAKKCVNVLSRKLGNNVWFFGDLFSEFDTIVYAYLSILYKISLPNNPIQNHIKGCQNLVDFIERISKDIFKNEAFSSQNANNNNINTKEHNNKSMSSENGNTTSESKTKLFAAVGAVIAMGSFAAWRGFYNQLVKSKHYYGDDYGYNYDEDADGDDDVE